MSTHLHHCLVSFGCLNSDSFEKNSSIFHIDTWTLCPIPSSLCALSSKGKISSVAPCISRGVMFIFLSPSLPSQHAITLCREADTEATALYTCYSARISVDCCFSSTSSLLVIHTYLTGQIGCVFGAHPWSVTLKTYLISSCLTLSTVKPLNPISWSPHLPPSPSL